MGGRWEGGRGREGREGGRYGCLCRRMALWLDVVGGGGVLSVR